MQQNPDQNGELMDIEDLNRLGRVRGPCPFYLSREMAATANIVFMPYNYLVDPKIRGGLQTQWANAVLIFDEAHNIEVPPQSTAVWEPCADLQTASLGADTLQALRVRRLTPALHSCTSNTARVAANERSVHMGWTLDERRCAGGVLRGWVL